MNHEDGEEITTTDEFIRDMLADDSEDHEFARAFLKEAFLASVLDMMREARRAAGLRQEDVARTLNTKQSGVARWETDRSGAMSLRAFADFILACGRVPLAMTAPLRSVVEFVLANPANRIAADTYLTWRSEASRSPNLSPSSPPTVTGLGISLSPLGLPEQPQWISFYPSAQASLSSRVVRSAEQSPTWLPAEANATTVQALSGITKSQERPEKGIALSA